MGENLALDVDLNHLPAFDGVGRNFGAMGGEVAMDDKFLNEHRQASR